MNADWQISAGYLSEFLRPGFFALAAVLSALVLADARRTFGNYAVAAWTFFTLLLPHVVFPLYLVARMFSSHISSDKIAAQSHQSDDQIIKTDEKTDERRRWSVALPLVYALVVAATGALYFHTEYAGADAHLFRARTAKLFGRRERAMREYRAALALEPDAHTHKLFGLELSEAGLWQEALAELRAAEQKGEPDDALPFHVASALDALGRAPEAAAEYQKFLQGRLCAQTPPDSRCESARAQVSGGVPAR